MRLWHKRSWLWYSFLRHWWCAQTMAKRWPVQFSSYRNNNLLCILRFKFIGMRNACAGLSWEVFWLRYRRFTGGVYRNNFFFLPMRYSIPDTHWTEIPLLTILTSAGPPMQHYGFATASINSSLISKFISDFSLRHKHCHASGITVCIASM